MNEDYVLDKPLTKEELAERARLFTSIFKQLITLNSSAIALIALFSSSFTGGCWLANVFLSFAPLAFLASLVFSFFLLTHTTMRQVPNETKWLFEDWIERWSFYISWGGFPLGILCLAVPAWFNFVSELF